MVYDEKLRYFSECEHISCASEAFSDWPLTGEVVLAPELAVEVGDDMP